MPEQPDQRPTDVVAEPDSNNRAIPHMVMQMSEPTLSTQEKAISAPSKAAAAASLHEGEERCLSTHPHPAPTLNPLWIWPFVPASSASSHSCLPDPVIALPTQDAFSGKRGIRSAEATSGYSSPQLGREATGSHRDRLRAFSPPNHPGSLTWLRPGRTSVQTKNKASPLANIIVSVDTICLPVR